MCLGMTNTTTRLITPQTKWPRLWTSGQKSSRKSRWKQLQDTCDKSPCDCPDHKQYKLQPRPPKFNEFDRECNVEGGEKVLAESKVPSRATPSSGCSSMASVTDLTGNFMRHEDDVTVIPVERIVSKDYGEDTRQTIGKVEWTSTFASLPLCQICILFMASK